MKIFHIVWAVCSVGLSIGVNEWTKPRVDYPLSIGERTMSTGNLTLKVGSSSHDFGLIDLHTVAHDVHQTFGRIIVVREMWMRSPQEDQDTAPDLELFFDLKGGAGMGHFGLEARDVKLLIGRPLPVLVEPVGREGQSRIRLPGSEEPVPVVEGTLTIEDAIEFETPDAAASWRVRGELELVARDGEADRTMRGRLRARLVWN